MGGGERGAGGRGPLGVEVHGGWGTDEGAAFGAAGGQGRPNRLRPSVNWHLETAGE